MSREPIYCSIYWQTLYTVCTTHEREVRVRTHFTKYVHTPRLTAVKFVHINGIQKNNTHKKNTQKNDAHKPCAKIYQDDECKNPSLQLHQIALTKCQNLLYNYLYSLYLHIQQYICILYNKYLFPGLCILHSNVSNGLNRRIITTTNNK